MTKMKTQRKSKTCVHSCEAGPRVESLGKLQYIKLHKAIVVNGRDVVRPICQDSSPWCPFMLKDKDVPFLWV